MTPEEFNAARKTFGLGRRAFGRLLGYNGEDRNIWIAIKRMETGERPITEQIGRLVQMLLWFWQDHGYLPDLNANGWRVPFKIKAEIDD